MSPNPDKQRVALTVPARTDHLDLLRLNVAAVAGASFDLDEVEDMKIAVEELAAALVGLDGADPEVHIEVRLDDTRLEVTGHRSRSGDGPVELEEFARTVLNAVVDRYSFDAEDGRAHFRFEKHLRAG